MTYHTVANLHKLHIFVLGKKYACKENLYEPRAISTRYQTLPPCPLRKKGTQADDRMFVVLL